MMFYWSKERHEAHRRWAPMKEHGAYDHLVQLVTIPGTVVSNLKF